MRQTIVNGVEVIKVEGSNSDIYANLFKHTPENNREERFLNNLKNATEANVTSFYVPVYGPSLDTNGQLLFIPGRYPAVNRNSDENKKLGEKRGFYLGTIEQWDLFLGTMIDRLMKIEGWSIEQAFHAICDDSTELGNYDNSPNARCRIENTGLRMVAGVADLANTKKMVFGSSSNAKDDSIYLVGGSYSDRGYFYPLASRGCEIDWKYDYVTGFFVTE